MKKKNRNVRYCAGFFQLKCLNKQKSLCALRSSDRTGVGGRGSRHVDSN